MREPARTRRPAEILAPRLEQFLVVAEEENITRAAARLGVGQPALGRTITRLEDELGAVLLHRDGRRVRLTAVGRALADELAPLLAGLDERVSRLLPADHPPTGTLTVGFVKSLADEVVPAMISGFHRRHPGVAFSLTEDGNTGLVAALRDGGIDLALLAPDPGTEDIAVEVLDHQELLVEVPRGHRLAGAGTVTAADLAGEQFVVMSSGYGTRQIFDLLCDRAGFTPRIGFSADDTRTLRALVASGTGVALLPPVEPPHPDTVTLRVTDPPAVREVCLAWNARARLSAPARAFRDFMLAQRGRLFA